MNEQHETIKRLTDAFNEMSEAFIRFSLAFNNLRLMLDEEDQPNLIND